jgi:hypothetical protein
MPSKESVDPELEKLLKRVKDSREEALKLVKKARELAEAAESLSRRIKKSLDLN